MANQVVVTSPIGQATLRPLLEAAMRTTDHHRSLNLPTHPHHKHNGIRDRIVASPAPTLDQVLDGIEDLIDLAQDVGAG